MLFNHDSGLIQSILTIDTTIAPPLGGQNSLQIVGTGALVLPVGTLAQRPAAPVAGMQRFNSESSQLEYYSGAAWVSGADGTVTSVTVESDAANSTALTVTNGTVTTAGTVTLTLDTTLVNFATLTGGGLVVNDADTFAARTLTAGNGIDITNGDGIAGDPTIAVEANLQSLNTLATAGFVTQTSVDGVNTYATKSFAASGDINLDEAAGVLTFSYTASGDSAAIAAMTDTGVVVRSATDPLAYVTRSLTEVAGQTVVTNGSFVSADASVGLAEVTNAGDGGTFVKVTTDAYGRVSNSTAVTTADITALVDSTYVDVAGDTMTGNLNMGGTYTVTGLTAPTAASDAATKNYVDSLAGGLSWQEPVVSVGATLPATATTGDRFVNTTDGKIYTATATNTWDAGVASADGYAVFDKTDEAGYVYSGSAWVQFTGTGQITAGTALSKSGNTLDVNLGAGVTATPSDEVGIDIYAGSALFLTEDGSATSAATGAQLAVRTGSGLTQTTDGGIYIDAAAITNSMLANSVVTFSANSGTADAVSLGETLAIEGTGAVSTAVSANKVEVSVATATDAVLGVASFASADFTVTTGAVTLVGKSIDAATDVDTTTVAPGTGDLLNWNGTNWVPVSQSAVAPDLSLDELTDVVITTAATGDVLYKTATDWVNGAPGATSGVQAYDAGLASLAAVSSVGIVVQSVADTFVTRSLVAGTGISIDDLTGATGDITISNTGVTSVGLTLPGIFDVTGSPVTTTGDLTATLATQTAGTVFAGPVTGAVSAPSFRALAQSDLGLVLFKENGASAVAQVATGDNAVALGSAASAVLTGQVAHASGQFSAAGDAQAIEMVLRGTTSGAGVTELFLDGASAQAALPANSAWTFMVQIVGRRTDATGGAAAYRFDGIIVKDGASASTAFIGTPSKNVLGETQEAWDAAVVADTTNGALKVTVTGEAAKAIKWVATIRATQVVG